MIEYLLKFAFAPSTVVGHNRRLWRLSLRKARRQIADLLAESPGLNPWLAELFQEAWISGRNEALKFLEVPDDAIAKAPLWSFDQAIDENFIPSND